MIFEDFLVWYVSRDPWNLVHGCKSVVGQEQGRELILRVKFTQIYRLMAHIHSWIFLQSKGSFSHIISTAGTRVKSQWQGRKSPQKTALKGSWCIFCATLSFMIKFTDHVLKAEYSQHSFQLSVADNRKLYFKLRDRSKLYFSLQA